MLFYFLSYIGVEGKWNYRQGRNGLWTRAEHKPWEPGRPEPCQELQGHSSFHSAALPRSLRARLAEGEANGFAVLWGVTENARAKMTLEISS